MTRRPKIDPSRADRFVSGAGDIIVHRPTGSKPIPGVRTTIGEAPDRPRPTMAALGTLRRERGQSQTQVAERMGLQQSHISRLERANDAKVSTLVQFVRSLGGEAELVVHFKDGAEIGVPLR